MLDEIAWGSWWC